MALSSYGILLSTGAGTTGPPEVVVHRPQITRRVSVLRPGGVSVVLFVCVCVRAC